MYAHGAVILGYKRVVFFKIGVTCAIFILFGKVSLHIFARADSVMAFLP